MRIMGFILVTTLFINCKHEKTAVSNFESYPDIETINKNSFYKQKIDLLTSIYNLPAISKGTKDSLIIRFWPWEAFELWSNMFEFRLDSTGWKGYHYCSYTFPGQDGKIIHVDGNEKFGDSVFMVKQIIPKCGWNKFYDSINIFHLKNLPTQKLIDNFQDQGIRDGDGVDFEIATKNFYRWIQYNNPDNCTYQECKSITQLTEMIVRQFGHEYSWPRVMIKKIGFCDTKDPLHF